MPLIKRSIPRSGEQLPVLGLGTYIVLDVPPGASELAELKEVLKTFTAGGARLIDSSPMYGRAEAVVGELVAAANLRESVFLATKVWTSGRDAGVRQMQDSLRLMRTQRIDLMQVHNLLDLATHTKTLADVVENSSSAGDELKAAVAAVGNDCKACHDKFRSK